LFKIASGRGFTETVRLLLKNGASVDYTNADGFTALFNGEKIV
jgi:hypothetical protein